MQSVLGLLIGLAADETSLIAILASPAPSLPLSPPALTYNIQNDQLHSQCTPLILMTDTARYEVNGRVFDSWGWFCVSGKSRSRVTYITKEIALH